MVMNLNNPWTGIAVVPTDGKVRKILTEKGISVKIIQIPPIRPWLIREIIVCIFEIRKVCLSNQVDLLYCNGSRAAFYGGLAGRSCGIPSIWHCRIADKDPLMDSILICLSSHIIANSQATAERFSRRVSSMVTVLYNGFDIDWLQSRSIEKPKIIEPSWKPIIVVSRVSRWKHHDIALTAFEKVAVSDRHLHLFFVGAKDPHDQEWWDYLHNRVDRSPVKNRIHWISWVKDVRPWYRASKMLVLPSINEPFGRVVVEAMASGVPVIATDSGGIPEILEDGRNGLMVKAGDADGMALAMETLLYSEAERHRLIKAGLKRAKDFGLETHMLQMMHFFDDLSSQSS